MSYAESWDLAAEIATIASDIRADLLPMDPGKAQTLAEKLFSLDQVIFERADDSNGSIGSELRDACVLWLDAAAAKRAAESSGVTPWAELLYDFYQKNGYGIREPLLKEAHRLLGEAELRGLAARFERDAVELIKHTTRGAEGFYRAINPASAMGLVAEALRDPRLHERSIRIYSPEPNELQSLDIAKHYVECGDAQGALRWLQGPWQNNSEHERLRLLDRAYALTGDTARRIEIRRNAYQQAPSVHTYRALAELLREDDRAELRGHACVEAMTNRDVAIGAELLFELNDDKLIRKIEAGLAQRYLSSWDFPGAGAGQNRLYIDGTAVNGRISDNDEGPTVVVDGREYGWEEFGRFLSPFTGFNFRLECFDASEDPETTPYQPRPNTVWWREEAGDEEEEQQHH